MCLPLVNNFAVLASVEAVTFFIHHFPILFNLQGDQPSLLARGHLTFTAPTIQSSTNEALEASRPLQMECAMRGSNPRPFD